MENVVSQASLNVPGLPEPKCWINPIVVTAIIKTFLFLLAMVFLLCLPLGDPDEQCAREACLEPQSKSVAYSYMCNIYKAMSSTISFTKDSVHTASRFAGCVLINALYDIKLKFYNILGTVDRQDLCRSVCCLDREEVEEQKSQTSLRDMKTCKCKGKCCKRVQPQK